MIIGQIQINNIGKNSIYDNICTLADDIELFENICNGSENNDANNYNNANYHHDDNNDVIIKCNYIDQKNRRKINNMQKHTIKKKNIWRSNKHLSSLHRKYPIKLLRNIHVT